MASFVILYLEVPFSLFLCLNCVLSLKHDAQHLEPHEGRPCRKCSSRIKYSGFRLGYKAFGLFSKMRTLNPDFANGTLKGKMDGCSRKIFILIRALFWNRIIPLRYTAYSGQTVPLIPV